MKVIHALINSNIYISLGAVFLAISTQVQLGMRPQWHPYLFIIFFATLFEYNLHRFVTVLTNKEALNSDKHTWVRNNIKLFYILVFISVVGFIIAISMAKKEVLVAFAPIAALTLFYSVPVFKSGKNIFRLREIPGLKIFLISFVWSAITIMLPVIQTGLHFDRTHIILMIMERFFFIFTITIPFDVRDMIADRKSGLKTLPLLLGEKKSIRASMVSLLIFFMISFFHYQSHGTWFMVYASGISAITTLIFLMAERLKKLDLYYYGILDGTLLFQGLLVLVFYFLQ